MQTCEVLELLREDLKERIKLSSTTFERTYKLGPGSEIKIAVNELEKADNFQLLVDSSSGLLEARVDGYRKAPPLLVGLSCQKVAEYLVDRPLVPCESMTHGGADEILSLYKCVREFKMSPTIPFSQMVKSSAREYRIFSIEQESNRYRLELMTNHIYGDSMKTIAEVGDEAMIPEQCYGLLERMVGEWFRPESVKSVKFALSDLERSTP